MLPIRTRLILTAIVFGLADALLSSVPALRAIAPHSPQTNTPNISMLINR
ncbi:MAG: hypothetical protein HC866_12210 [Leptolyngbyaceae cyanobacterium RU_5_1]|nr:hypothetical protein [Leptolyngbyaceae cyanobacterium RU_5_1]